MSEVLVFQDGDDIRNGVLQLSIIEERTQAIIYFRLLEWQTFKEAINKFEYGKETHTNYIKNNPVDSIGQDGSAVSLQFGCGELSVMLYFQSPKNQRVNKRWEIFKRQVTNFCPEEKRRIKND